MNYPPPSPPVICYAEADTEPHRGSGRRREGEKSFHVLLPDDSPHKEWAESRGRAIGGDTAIIGTFPSVMSHFRENPNLVGIIPDSVSQHHRYHLRRDMPPNVIPLSLYSENDERLTFSCGLIERQGESVQSDWLVECYPTTGD